MATNTGPVVNLANSIIGVSVIAMPFCFKECGITLGILMLILSSIMSRLACHFLVKSSLLCKRRNFEFLAFYTFGPSGKLLVELGIIGFMMGTCVAFFVVMGDLGPAIVSKFFTINNTSTLRTSVLISIGLFIVLPLGLLKNIESLAAVSAITVSFYFLLVIKIFLESSSHLIAGDWIDEVRFWQPEGILQCIPIFAMSLSCQMQIFEIYDSLPTPGLEKINGIVRAAVNMCTVVYISVGFLGYVAFSTSNFSGNILLSFSPSFSSELYKLGFVLSIALSFPLVIFPCRASLHSLLFRKLPIHHELTSSSHIPDSRFKCLTITIVAMSLIIGLLIPSIELVLGFVGSTIGVAICVIFPALTFINMTNKDTNERLMAKVTLIIGLVIMVVGTFGNLNAAAENRPIDLKLEDSHLKIPLVKPQTEGIKSVEKDNSKPKPIIGIKPLDIIKPKVVPDEVQKIDEKRIEPPNPIPPEKIIPSQVSIIKQSIDEPKKEPEKSNEASELKAEGKQVEDAKLHEPINKDAIEKEEKELNEVKKQQKMEQEQKEQELLKKLKEHEDEQKKLLQEQEKILMEMKNRESEKKPENQGIEKKPENRESEKKPEVEKVNDVEPIKPEEFKKNIDTIQNVIDNLKDTNEAIEKEKKKEVVEESKKSEQLKLEPLDVKPLNNQIIELVKSKIPLPIPIPLAKLQNNSLKVNKTAKEEVKSKQEAMGRDILGETEPNAVLTRQKRDVSNEECSRPTTDKISNTDLIENRNISKEAPEIIKNSLHLTLSLNKDKIPEIEASKIIPIDPDLSLIPKKRDLKFYDSNLTVTENK